MKHERPPHDAPVSTWISDWLPAAYARHVAQARASTDGLNDLPSLRLTVTGDGGGDFFIRGASDHLDIQTCDRDAPEPEIWIRMTAADLRATVEKEADLPAFLSEDASLLDVILMVMSKADLIRNIKGRIRFEVTGKRRRRFTTDLGFARPGIQAGRPRATISVDGTNFERLMQGQLAPLQALVQGTVKLEGDRSTASQLLLLMGSIFTPDQG